MNAAQLMTLEVRCVDEDTPVSVAWELMQTLKVHHLPVVEGKKLVGIISDRDLLVRATRGLDGKLTFPDLCAAEVMAFHPPSVGPDATVRQIAAEMLDRQADAIPVVSPGGELVGLVTSSDLLKLVVLGASSSRH